MIFVQGDKVRVNEYLKTHGPYYPPVGTIGTVLIVGRRQSLVEWPEGTVVKKNAGVPPTAWYIRNEYIDKVAEDESQTTP